jgi:D-xylulose reductase
MKAVVLEKKQELTIRDIDLPLELGTQDLKIRIHTAGICGSDIHYYLHGRIGPFVVEEPMVLGHEASGTVVEVGTAIKTFEIGDRVCMEPGIPNLGSRASLLGMYNVDPSVRFWATPPVNGCLTPFVVHPAAFCFHLPDNVSYAEGAMVEPFAIGMQAAAKASLKPGDVALVTGAGTIGMMTALAALTGGCSHVFISDLAQEKLNIIGKYANITPVNIQRVDLKQFIAQATGDWGVDVVFEASGDKDVYAGLCDLLCPGGTFVMVGMPVDCIKFDVVAAQAKEITVRTIFRYANMFDRAINLIASGRVDLKPLITHTFPWEQSVEAFRLAAEAHSDVIKIQLLLDEATPQKPEVRELASCLISL